MIAPFYGERLEEYRVGFTLTLGGCQLRLEQREENAARCENGLEAWEMHHREHADVILSDWRMPRTKSLP